MDVDDIKWTSPGVPASAAFNLLPEKSRRVYEKTYAEFITWCENKQVKRNSESVLLAYFSEIAERGLIASLWPKYSMLKATLSLKDKIDISEFKKLITFIKRAKIDHRPKKSKVFEKEQVQKFISEAPNSLFLITKVALIFGVAGALRKDELVKLETDDVQDLGSKFLVTIKVSKTKTSKIFTIIDNEHKILNLIRRYISLRPVHTPHKRFFIYYKHNKCSVQPVGINTLSKWPSCIADFLKLEQPHLYTGHCFRRSSDAGADFAVIKRYGGWKSKNVAEGLGVPAIPLANYRQRVLCATGISRSSFKRIRKESAAIDTGASTGFSTPHKKRPRRSRLLKKLGFKTTTPSTPASIPAPEFIDCQGIGAQCKNISLPPLQNIESPSTSALLYLEPETNLRLDKCEEPTTESVYQDDDDGSGEDSDAVDNKDDMLDVSNTQILLNEVEPLSVEVEPLSVEVNPQYAMPKECELFGEYIAKHLQQLPFDVAFNLQSRIQTLVLQTRLEYIRQHPTKGPPMVKQETLVEDDHDYTKTTTNQPPSDNPVQIRGEKRLRNTDQPKAKRFNIDNRSSETQSSNSQTTHGKHKRTECTVFAEQIALHLEQLPEDVSLRLQSDIYELVMQVLPKPTDQDIPNRVKIKDEIIEVSPNQMMDEQSCETV